MDVALFILTFVSALAAAAAALVGWLTLRSSRRIERADSERTFVEWQVDRLSDGRFEVVNIGADVAHEVTVEAWTADELGGATADAVRPQSQSNDVVLVVLPGREAGGPAEPELPRPAQRPGGYLPPVTVERVCPQFD